MASPPTGPAPPPPGLADTVRRRKPGILSPKGEKALHKAVSSDDVVAISQVASDFPDYAIPSRVLAGLMLAAWNEAPRAKELLDAVFRSESDPGAHPFMRKYLPAMGFQVGIAPGITAALPLSRDSLGLLLGEVYQAMGDLTSAIDVVEQVDSTTHAAVSLADLYIEAGRYDDVVELTEGISNEDDSTALLLVFRGIALREKGYNDAAREAFKEALKSKKRDPVIRHRALLERSRSYLSDGKKAQAKKDLERILAEDSTYEGLQAALAGLENR